MNRSTDAEATAVERRAPARPKRPILVYPGFDVMSEQDHWDPATRELIRRRISSVPPIRFFSEAELDILSAVVEQVMPQDERPPDCRVPIVPWIDQRCFERIIDGWRFEDMPPDHEAWRLGLRGIDEAAHARFGRGFANLEEEQQAAVLRAVADGEPPGSAWQHLPARRFWIYVVLRQITSIYYAHPFAWNEIGFGGPAYPRGYFALNHGNPEPWEAREVRLDEASD